MRKRNKGEVVHSTTPTAEGSTDAAPLATRRESKKQKAKREAADAEAARVAADVAAANAAKPATSKFKGRGTVPGIPSGLRRMDFQDRLLAWNETQATKKTDLELAAMMDAEHPGGVAIRPDHMRAIRRLYNAGRHTKLATVPAVPSKEYAADGSVVPEKRSRLATKAA